MDKEKELDADSDIHIPSFILPPRLKISLAFENIAYKVDDTVILDDISGNIYPGEFFAIMGSTGSGKTSLLSILSSRMTSGVSGTISANNSPINNDYKRHAALVTQTDILFANLTVEQTLQYTAELKLYDMDPLEIKTQINSVIEALNLTKIRKSVVGDDDTKTISGGEKRRVNIANELLTRPSIIFLDEPTSGLDTATSTTMMRMLKYFTTFGISIVVSIHHPSKEVFDLFDKVMFLSHGHTVYYGHRKNIRPYFKQLGYRCARKNNPADYVMSIVLKEELKNKGESETRSKLIENWRSHSTKLNQLSHTNKLENTTHVTDEIVYNHLSRVREIGILTRRAFYQNKGIHMDKFDFIQIFIFAVIMGAMWFQLPRETDRIHDRTGVLFISLLFIAVFRPAYIGLFEFPFERSIIQKERFSGTYKLSSYYISKMLAEAPFLLIHPTFFYIILYFMVGFRLSADGFLITYLLYILAVYCCNSLGLVVSSMTGSNIKVAILLLDSFLMSFSNVSGYWNVNMPIFISWMRYISPITYTFQGILINEFYGTQWTISNTDANKVTSNSTIFNVSSNVQNMTGMEYISGEKLISTYNLWFTSPLFPILITVGWIVFYRILAFIILHFKMK